MTVSGNEAHSGTKLNKLQKCNIRGNLCVNSLALSCAFASLRNA